jgi:hypothetical protein
MGHKHALRIEINSTFYTLLYLKTQYLKWHARIKLFKEMWYSILQPGICWVSNNSLVINNYYARLLNGVHSAERTVFHVRVKFTFHPKGRT